MPEPITDESLRAAILAVADEQPDHVYKYPGESEECYYVHGDAPGCIIGAALHRLGVSLTVLSGMEFVGAGLVLSNVAPDVSDNMRHAAAAVQEAQDSGETWGEAVARLRVGTMTAVENARLLSVVRQIVGLHVKCGDVRWPECGYCFEGWPCATVDIASEWLPKGEA